jgi:hypothetical protein
MKKDTVYTYQLPQEIPVQAAVITPTRHEY